MMQNVDSIKYLGVTIDRRVTWTEYIDSSGVRYYNFHSDTISIR